jgi:phage tail tape-measure protein
MTGSYAALETEFDSFFDLFRNDGYKRLIEQLSNQLSLIDNLMDTKDLDDLRIRQGQISVLKQLINFEHTTRNEYEQWLSESST